MDNTEWSPVDSYWQLEILGNESYWHVTQPQMDQILTDIGNLKMIIHARDIFDRSFHFAADKYAGGCWCSPEVRDRIALATKARKDEEDNRINRLGLWDLTND